MLALERRNDTPRGVSVTDVRHEPGASYAMAEGPDGLLIEIFQPDPAVLPAELRDYFA